MGVGRACGLDVGFRFLTDKIGQKKTGNLKVTRSLFIIYFSLTKQHSPHDNSYTSYHYHKDKDHFY